ncbi:ABC transporter ATP-binding protein [Mesorhizobium sp. M1B.F.Ca.ET.045.04.1.1]|uniref:ABC transporter ATP-binding protein n=1 Tax=Mesorhizobium sp. M1B.F.Ca.ET.045.04.1.1 TaxID=2493673 RepID=UPI000F75E3A9|nr:ABC transporter ATP-binding protein [Mesorhizobium sp. M1B.F.Ca.ET.045.04.1.1]AZO32319.1 ABC transporter ATP-binding protein [Mesorhizobium sp. M1B.F.Ca.ET.045.04.1.1]
MSSEPFDAEGRNAGTVIRVCDVSKHYAMFERPEDRFKQMVMPRLGRLLGRPPRRYFRDFAALNGISFDIGRGETVGIIGRNGSGKSTLLQIICGTLQPTSGAVEVNGRIAALLELGAGFNPEFTGRENVFLNASILGIPRKEMEWRFDDIARFADIGPFIDQPVKTYSSGMYVRLAFATAINVDPDILVVDEALSVGDEAFQRKCFARIEDIKDKGGTILFVSHGAQTIVQLCTRAVLIDGGEKIFEGRPKAVTGHYQRLVNAPSEAASEIRAEIAALGAKSSRIQVAQGASDTSLESMNIAVESETIGGGKQLQASEFPTLSVSDGTEAAVDYYDPSLISQSAVGLEERGARIRDIRVVTLHGEAVNVLQMSKRYILEYYVDFASDATNVSFGFAVRTVSGFTVAGATSTDIASLKTKAVRGSSLKVCFEFSCLLLPDTYFFGCTVYGVSGQSSDLMHRIVDALIIRVAPESDLLAKGLFDMSPQLRLESIVGGAMRA